MQFANHEDRKAIGVLVIEDDDYTRECIGDYLELVGFTAIRAAGGREGIELFGQHKPDVVVTDIKMPEVSGFDILKFMQDFSNEIPVIVISGTDSLDDVTQCLKLGVWDYIIKPIYDYSVVEMAILRALEKKKLIEENRRYKEYLEEEVIKRSDEVLRGTVRFRTLFNLASDVLFIYAMDGQIIDCNEQAVRSTGYSRTRLLEMNMRDVIDAGDPDHLQTILEKLSARKSFICETRLKRRGGGVTLMEEHMTLVATNSTHVLLAVCRDISERRRIEQEREELEKRIASAQRMELTGMLAGGIAHDFNNILTALTGYASLLQAALGETGGKPLDYANKVSDIAAKGRALTDRLMSFVRKKREELAPIDVHKALRDTETLLRPNAGRVKIVLDLGAEMPMTLGGESQLQNAFLNLGLNARDAMQGGGTLTFKTRNESGGKGADNIRIEVSDTGCGMDEEVMRKIFEPLFTTKDAGIGTGLGLPSVLYCVKNMHGSIDVKSEIGAGTTFSILLPVYKEDAAPTAAQSAPSEAAQSGAAKLEPGRFSEAIAAHLENMAQQGKGQK